MNGLEDRLRRGLDAPFDVGPSEELLARVSVGARRRRQRRTAAMVAGAAATVAAVALGSVLLGGPTSSPEPQPAPPGPTLPPAAPVGVVDVAVPDADHVFALTADEGSTVWLWNGGGTWQRLHDFQQPVEYVEFAPDARNGWAWGDTLFSTHDGGQTWKHLPSGLITLFDGTSLSLTRDRAWGIQRTDGLDDYLLSTPVDSDDWTSTVLPAQVNDLFTARDRVVLEESLSGVDTPRLLSGTDGETWSRLDFPCPGENQAYPGTSAVLVLCPAAGGATVYRSVDLASWQVFGHSDLTAVTAVLPLSDDLLLLVGEPNDLLVTSSGSQPVDVGLHPGEEIFQGAFGTAGDTTYAVSSEHRILVSTDAGENWSELG